MNSTNDKKINPETAAHKPSPRLRVPNPRLTAAPSPAMPTTTSGPHEGGEGGEGGGQPRSAVTNENFLLTLFHALDEGAKVLALAKPGNPHTGGWVGFDAVDAGRRCGFNTNNFFNCASFSSNECGELRALEAQAVAYHCLVLDNIGTKTPLDAVPAIEPTWVLETSPGNFQIGYRLAVPITDPAAVKAAQKKVFGSGLGDKGAGGMARWVRLPIGINGKPKYADESGMPFQCRLVTWHPEVSYELEELVALLAPETGILSGDVERSAVPLSTRAGDKHPSIPGDVFSPARLENSVIVAVKDAGLYQRESSSGVHEIRCPWSGEHTDPNEDRAYLFEPSHDYPMGGFKCHHSHGDKYRLGALLEHLGLTPSDLHNKSRIRIVEGELQAMVDAAQVVLAATGEFFQAGGLIVRVAIDKSTGVASLQPQTDADLTLALSSAAQWERSNGKDRWLRCNPSPNCIRLLIQVQSYAHLPFLKGIARQPMLLADGELISQAGFDLGSGYYCAFDTSKFARAEPTEANAREALARLEHLVREFRFATPRDRATALAAIITAVLRPTLGRVPGFHVRAPAPGSGKSLLCDVIARFAGPGSPAKISYPRTEEEATKVILAALLGAPAVLDFDDMSSDWRPFGAINRLLTSATISDRLLGMSKMATVSTDTLVLGSGNNTGPTGDLSRRVLVIDLDTRDESPATLRYEGDPLRDVEANREAFVADALLIVEAWIAAGKPKSDLSPIATYGGRWTDYCRHALVWLGLDDSAEGLIEQLKTDPDSAALGRLLTTWHGQLGSKPRTLRALLDAADGDLLEAIEDLPFAEGGPINRGSFGRYLGRNAGRPVHGLKLEKANSRERNAWRVIPLDAPVAPWREGATTPPSPASPPLAPPRNAFD